MLKNQRTIVCEEGDIDDKCPKRDTTSDTWRRRQDNRVSLLVAVQKLGYFFNLLIIALKHLMMVDEGSIASSLYSSSQSSRSSCAGVATSSSSSSINPNNFKSTLYFSPFNNCEKLPIRLVAKSWDKAKTSKHVLVNTFLLYNLSFHSSWCYRVMSKYVKVYPSKGVIEKGATPGPSTIQTPNPYLSFTHGSNTESHYLTSQTMSAERNDAIKTSQQWRIKINEKIMTKAAATPSNPPPTPLLPSTFVKDVEVYYCHHNSKKRTDLQLENASFISVLLHLSPQHDVQRQEVKHYLRTLWTQFGGTMSSLSFSKETSVWKLVTMVVAAHEIIFSSLEASEAKTNFSLFNKEKLPQTIALTHKT
ncbi:hypothetical protein CEXT_479371 [Caerostris extrusa]|uniref:Uncharacterized protein n=1 Tax=Caerostris extrusa TaxID=172846 RepID=A0AAV4PYK5_CAEEX|nr:hypothetical protein CEXT_479371 [Caerostris extrusa]